MAAVKPQILDDVEAVKTGAAAANSVPDLRQQVIDLADIVEKLQAKIAKLERRRR
jgi:hypothetical protein